MKFFARMVFFEKFFRWTGYSPRPQSSCPMEALWYEQCGRGEYPVRHQTAIAENAEKNILEPLIFQIETRPIQDISGYIQIY